MTKLKYERHGTDFEVDVATLSDDAKLYLMQYGWAQSLQDSVAGRRKKYIDDLVSTNEGKTAADFTDDADLHELGLMQKRMTAIIEQTLGTRVASGKSAYDKLFDAVANEMLRAAAKRLSKKLPKKDSKDFADLLERFTEKHREAIENETKFRLEREAGLVSSDDFADL